MKYFNIQSLQASITRIREGNITHEHRTGTAALGLARNYFHIDKYAITPEQIQEYTKKRPDLTIEYFREHTGEFIPHCFIEVKSLVNSNIGNIVDQLFDTVHYAMASFGDTTGTHSVFMIAIKGTKIAFYVYHTFHDILDDYGINHYRGFIPLNYLIPEDEYMAFNHSFPLAENAYQLYKDRLNFATDSKILSELGALATKSISHPHILDLLDDRHCDHIHNMYTYVADKNPNAIFAK